MADLGLALSGGGFRATLFHLGVVRYLRDAGALHRVTDIASVSGGSILAAHMALNWNRYTGEAEAFDEAAAEIVRFVQFDVRNHIARRLALQAPLLFLYAPIQLYELQQRARQQADIIDAITRGNPDIHQVLELVDGLPTETWTPDPVEERAEVSTLDYSDVELLTHNRILDLRSAPLPGGSQPATGYLHLYDRLTMKLKENDPAVEQIVLPYFITGENVEFRHASSSTAHTISRITHPVELYGVERTLYEVAHDMSDVPLGVSVEVGLEMRAEVPEEVSNAGFVVQLKTDLLSIWLLFPSDRPFRTYSLTRYPADRSLPPEAVEARYVIDHPYGSLIGWSVVNPTVDYIYDCRWTMR